MAQTSAADVDPTVERRENDSLVGGGRQDGEVVGRDHYRRGRWIPIETLEQVGRQTFLEKYQYLSTARMNRYGMSWAYGYLRSWHLAESAAVREQEEAAR
jgi:hypothetical protein